MYIYIWDIPLFIEVSVYFHNLKFSSFFAFFSFSLKKNSMKL